jgi:hypothetical protein
MRCFSGPRGARRATGRRVEACRAVGSTVSSGAQWFDQLGAVHCDGLLRRRLGLLIVPGYSLL